MSLYLGAEVKIIAYPFTSPGVYPIDRTGVVINVHKKPGVGYYDVRITGGGTVYCDGIVTIRGDELELLPIASPDAPEAVSDPHKGDDDGLAGAR